MEPEGSLTHSQMPAICSYPEPSRSSPSPQIPLPEDPSLILSFHLRFGLQSGSFSSDFPTKIMYTSLPSPTRATFLAHLILLDFITRKVLGEQYRSLISSLCTFLHSPVTSFHFCPNILLNTLLSNTLSLCSFFNVSDQVSHPYKTADGIIFLYICTNFMKQKSLKRGWFMLGSSSSSGPGAYAPDAPQPCRFIVLYVRLVHHVLNLQAPCVLYIRTGVSLLSRESFLYI